MKTIYWARVVFPSPKGDVSHTVHVGGRREWEAFKAAIAERGYSVAALGIEHVMTPQEAVNDLAKAVREANPGVDK